jgi:hypothetical protein
MILWKREFMIFVEVVNKNMFQCDLHVKCLFVVYKNTWTSYVYTYWRVFSFFTDVNECASNPCVHGNCRHNIVSYMCQCDSGYDGVNCHLGM